jgi:hypothetical protein
MKRRVRHPLWIVILAVCLAEPALAQSDSGPWFYVRAMGGYAWPMFGDVNAQICVEQAALYPVSSVLQWEELSGAPFGAGELGFTLTPTFSLGLGFGYQRSTRDHSTTFQFDTGTAIVNGTIEQSIEARQFTLMLTPTYRVPTAPGLHFGAQLGAAKGWFQRTENDDIFATDGSFLVGTLAEDYDQIAFAGGIFAGYDISASPSVAFTLRGGYLFSPFSGMDGPVHASGATDQGIIASVEHVELTDGSGNPLEVSFSGWNVTFGILLRAANTP